MMSTSWFKVTIKFQEVTQDDKVKNVTEAYLFDAVSYTDAEAKAYDFLAGGKPDFQLHSITKMKLVEVFFQENGAEEWFKIRVQYIIFDEKTKQEKKTAVMMLINAKNIKEAYEGIKDRLGVVEDYIISDINVTKILEVFPYEPSPEQILAKGNFTPMADVIPAAEPAAEPEETIETTEPEGGMASLAD